MSYGKSSSSAHFFYIRISVWMRILSPRVPKFSVLSLCHHRKEKQLTVALWLLSRQVQGRCFCSILNTSNRRARRHPFQSSPMVKFSGRTSVLGSPGLPPAVSGITAEFALESPSSLSLEAAFWAAAKVCVVGRYMPKMLRALLWGEEQKIKLIRSLRKRFSICKLAVGENPRECKYQGITEIHLDHEVQPGIN